MKHSGSITLRRIGLLMWKNILLRKRHKVTTIMQFLLPILFGMILVILSFLYSEDKLPTNNMTSQINVTDLSLSRTEEELVQNATREFFASLKGGVIVAFAPENPETLGIMNKINNRTQALITAGVMAIQSTNDTNTSLVNPNPKSPEMKLQGFKSEKLLEEAFTATLLKNETRQWTVAVLFENVLAFPNGKFPRGHQISYKIRIPSRLEEPNKTTGLLKPIPPRRIGSNNVMMQPFPSRFRQPINGLQILLDKAIVERLTGSQQNYTINIKEFPFPTKRGRKGNDRFTRPPENSQFIKFYYLFLRDIIVIGVIFVVPAVVSPIVSEKETGIKELMRMMGLPNWMHWVGWMLNSMMVLTLSMTSLVLLFLIPFSKNGKVLRYDDPSVLWVLLVLYSAAATSFCFFLSVFFGRPVLATAAGVVIWLVSYYSLSVPLDIMYDSVTLTEKMATALLPNMGLHWALKAMSIKEPRTGTQWRDVVTSVSDMDKLSVGYMFLMLIIDAFLYCFLAVYLESILPSEFGIQKPWYYIFQTEKWKCFRKVHPAHPEQTIETATDGQPGFEEELTNLVPGIVFQKLTKKFGKLKVAVKDLSFKMYTGQITALLGHNGAGKTTTISILTGIFPPTSGTAVINGFDINTQMSEIRSDLGLCPQHNMLFDELTIVDHLVFFGRLKGLTTKEAKEEIVSLVDALELKDKRHVFSKSLSGGQKRKLSLMIAVIGGTKVVILDEPTSGLDPEARRGIWDLLLALRGKRTIILTTHFMEEADVLGDRIAIMAGGKIKCCGTPIFLKKFYGTGYILKMTVNPDTSKDPILEVVRKHIEGADWRTQQFGHATDLAITLPNDNESISHFAAMFTEISENKEALGIVTIGLSLTSMDDVFSKVEELNREEIERNKPKDSLDTSTGGRRLSQTRAPSVMGKCDLFWLQFWALIIKRFLYTVQKRKLLICQILIPVLVLIACILIINGEFPKVDPPSEPLLINYDSYNDPKIVYSNSKGTGAAAIGANYARLIRPGRAVKVANVPMELMKIANQQYIVGAEFTDDMNHTAWFSPIHPHTAPLSINLVSNAILKFIAPDKNYSIRMSIQVLDNVLNKAKPILIYVETPRSFPSIYPLYGIFVPASLAVAAASFVVFPVEERLSKVKQLQLMTGVKPLIYWGSAFLWDFVLMAILASLMTPCFPIFEDFHAYTTHGGTAIVFLILMCYAWATIPFSYVCTLAAKTVPGAFAVVTLIHVLTGTILPMATLILLFFNETEQLSTIARHLGRPFPTFGVSISLMSFASTSVQNSRCNLLPENIKRIICNQTKTFPLERMCCENCATTGLMKCFKPEPYLQWDRPYRDHKIPELGQELVVVFVMGCTYIILLLLIEYGVFRRLQNFIFSSPKTAFEMYTNDEDVIAEGSRVKSLVEAGSVSEDAMVVDSLCKGYGSFAAVSKLSFGVHYGECFGLLGVNGAGKTTTFRILTGDETRSSGNAYILRYTFDKSRDNFLASVGYCPQFDAIIGVLSGRQMLCLFGRLRGIPSNRAGREADKWLTKLGLFEAGNVQCQKYSGGMKRRLSAGMAMIGDPQIILLDEPTSGVDPVARRQFWQVIAGVRDSGRSIILTSHSMDECEALCSRLGIMVNGQFQCFGGVQHLKNKFAQGYSLILKLKSHIFTSSDEAKPLIARVNELFEPCVLKDEHQNILHYQLMNTSMQWEVLFESIENLKKEFEEVVEDFSVNETTLEDVFLSFAKGQHPERKTAVSGCGKFLTCKR